MVKIVVIDDDDFVRGMIVSALKKVGYEVGEAKNGDEGIKIVQIMKPDVVLTDILMPDKEGIGTIMELKAINRDLKIIAMSGGGATQNMSFLDMAKKMGAHHTLKKPFKPADLLQAIDNLLK